MRYVIELDIASRSIERHENKVMLHHIILIIYLTDIQIKMNNRKLQLCVLCIS